MLDNLNLSALEKIEGDQRTYLPSKGKMVATEEQSLTQEQVDEIFHANQPAKSDLHEDIARIEKGVNEGYISRTWALSHLFGMDRHMAKQCLDEQEHFNEAYDDYLGGFVEQPTSFWKLDETDTFETAAPMTAGEQRAAAAVEKALLHADLMYFQKKMEMAVENYCGSQEAEAGDAILLNRIVNEDMEVHQRTFDESMSCWEGVVPTMKSGDQFLDAVTGGFKRGTVSAVISQAGNGKTRFLATMINKYLRNGYSIIADAPECPQVFVDEAAKVFNDCELSGRLFVFDAGLNADNLINSLRDRIRSCKADMVVIDMFDLYAHGYEPSAIGARAKLTLALDRLAKEEDVAIIVSVQAMRQDPAMINDLRWSAGLSELAYRADKIFECRRTGPSIIDVLVRKDRDLSHQGRSMMLDVQQSAFYQYFT